VLCGNLGGIGGTSSRPLEGWGERPRASPEDHVALKISESDQGIVERRLDIRAGTRQRLSLTPSSASLTSSSCLWHATSNNSSHQPGVHWLCELLLLGTCAPATGHRPARSAFGSGIGPGTLAPHGQVATMPLTTVRPDLRQTLDVHRDFASKIALDLELPIDVLTNPSDIALRKVLDPRVWIHIGRLQDLIAPAEPNAIDVGQPYLYPSVPGKVYT
jgi:hypothetical protein